MLRLHRTDRGATAVIVAGSLFLLMGMAAMALDLGAGYNQRRQAQSAADFAALAAVQFSGFASTPTECAPQTGNALARCIGALEAMQVVQENLPDFSVDWVTCVDPDPSRHASSLFPRTAVVDGATIDCIRFSETTQAARVVDPTIQQPTSFGRIFGITEIAISAEAEAQGDLAVNSLVLPFGIPANADGSFDCLKSGPNPNWGVCQGNSTNGNFGYLDIPLYGNSTLGTVSDGCNPNNSSLVSNMVLGADHPIGTHSSGTASSSNPALNDDNGPDTSARRHVCPVFGSNANELPTQTGNVSGAFETGMIWGLGSSQRGRLWGPLAIRNPGAGNPRTQVNHTPLWNYLNPGACSGVTGVSGPVSNTTEMTLCLDAWRAGSVSGAIFSGSIASNSRYGFAPKLWESFSSSGDYLVRSIAPIFLHTSYYGCSSGGGPGGGRCETIHTPGEDDDPTADCPIIASSTGAEPHDTTCGVPGRANDSLNAVTAFILEPGMVPASALIPVQSDGSRIDIALTR